MIHILAQPHSVTVLLAAALIAVSAFTVIKVLATVPVASLDVLQYKARGVAVEQKYTGVIAWVDEDSIRITDVSGVERLFTTDDATQILMNKSARSRQSYTDLRVFDHVRITTLKDNLDEIAQVITVL